MQERKALKANAGDEVTFNIGSHVLVKLSGGRIVETKIMAAHETTDGRPAARIVWE